MGATSIFLAWGDGGVKECIFNVGSWGGEEPRGVFFTKRTEYIFYSL